MRPDARLDEARRRAVFLDRDGVINRAVVRAGRPYPPESLETLDILPGVQDALAALRRAAFHLVVVTNQPDVAAGRQRREMVEAMHDYLKRALPIDDIRVCYHIDDDQCGCRKPKPGMLLEAAAERRIALADSFMVGDRWRDIEAGRAAGCTTILVRSNYDERPADRPDFVVRSLLEASAIILGGPSGQVGTLPSGRVLPATEAKGQWRFE